MDRDRIILGREVGRGAYSSVYLIGDSETVCKVFDVDDTGIDTPYLREIAILKSLENLKHPNIVRFKSVLRYPRGANTIGVLLGYIPICLDRLSSKRVLLNSEIYDIITGVAQGLYAMHTRGIAHRDIKPSNILIKEPTTPVICDFNLAKSMDGLHIGGTHTEEVVTAPYRSPEVWDRRGHSFPVDLWSLGVILLEMIMKGTIHSHLRRVMDPRAFIRRKKQQHLNAYGPYRPPSWMQKTLPALLNESPEERMTAEQYLRCIKAEIIPVQALEPSIEKASVSLMQAFHRYEIERPTTRCLAAKVLRKTRCHPSHAVLLAMKMVDIDEKCHRRRDYTGAEHDLLEKLEFDLIISGDSSISEES